jgi:hypothetical protein
MFLNLIIMLLAGEALSEFFASFIERSDRTAFARENCPHDDLVASLAGFHIEVLIHVVVQERTVDALHV